MKTDMFKEVRNFLKEHIKEVYFGREVINGKALFTTKEVEEINSKNKVIIEVVGFDDDLIEELTKYDVEVIKKEMQRSKVINGTYCATYKTLLIIPYDLFVFIAEYQPSKGITYDAIKCIYDYMLIEGIVNPTYGDKTIKIGNANITICPFIALDMRLKKCKLSSCLECEYFTKELTYSEMVDIQMQDDYEENFK